MHALNKFLKQVSMIALLILFATTAYAVQVANDQYNSGLDGYSGSGIYWDSGGWMVLPRDTTGSKTYDFGASNANATLTITFGLYANDKWDSSDRFEVRVDGNKLGDYQLDNGGYIVRSITATADSNGRITLSFTANTNKNDEFGAVNYVTIDSAVAAATTTWLKNAAGDSATTDPSPYTNDSDATETLTIAGATQLTVTITGTLEAEGSCSYDYVTITDSAGVTSSKYCGSINDTFTATGPSVTLLFHSDYSVTDSGATVTITAPSSSAVDDSYTGLPDVQLVVDAATGLLVNDSGTGISITSVDTTGLQGTLNSYDSTTGAFTFTPDSGFTGNTTFTYTITDSTGNTSTATVTINIAVSTDYTTNMGFEQINPPSTQNIIGDYKIAGNTVLCLTELRTGYAATEGSCVDTTDLPLTSTSNNYVVKFIDIDGDSSTWNSSSSNITFPPTYAQNGGDGILWAGLIWQGRFAWEDSATCTRWNAAGCVEDLHYGTPSGWVETGQNTGVTTVSLIDANVRSIKLKINGGSYNDITAYKVYSQGFSSGVTYSAIADVTSLLRGANLAGNVKHTFTVANLPTEEGREWTPGVYGGWSLVVVYAEDSLNGKPRNVTIYGGMDSLKTTANATPILIDGFKLPNSGTVSAQLAIFSGEGEFDFTTDGLDVGLTSTGPWTAIPETGNNTNVFDGILSGVDRDTIAGHSNNLQQNNVGVDVDRFDISNIVSGFPRTTTSMYLRWWSNNDYVIPGMIAFSVELYQPSLCYDYTYDINGYVLESVNNEVNTTYHRLYPTLTTHVSIRSLEGDFPLDNVRFSVWSDPEYLSYQSNSAALAPNLIYGYSPVSVYNLNTPTASSFTMDVGNNIIAGSGGTINAFETTYTRFNHDMNVSKSAINTSMSMRVDFTVDYGSGDVPQAQLFDASSQCSGGSAYTPVYGKFNIVAEGANSDQYNLLSQVSGRPYNVKAYGYETDNTTVKSFSTAIEIEIFNANFFENDATLSCNNPDSNVTSPSFIEFGTGDAVGNPVTYSTSVDIAGQQFNVAQRNAGYRMWYLEKLDGSLVEHHCLDRNDGGCFQTVYTGNYGGDTYCTTACSGGSDCYSCLRKYYGRPVCSRDNFSIRPETYAIDLADGGTTIGQNTTQTRLAVAARYDYTMNIKALSYGTNTPAGRYVQGFGASTPFNPADTTAEGAVMVNDFENNANCTDINSQRFSFTFWDGSASNSAVAPMNVGDYRFHVLDTTWTAVDQLPTAQFGAGCVADSAAITNTSVGCNISSDYNNTVTGVLYEDFYLTALPYKFTMNALVYATNAANNNYVYSNTVGLAPGVDNNMSVNFTGLIAAQGKDNVTLSNFTTNCYARNIDLTYQSVSTPAVPTDINGNPLQLRFYERLGTNPTGSVAGTSKLLSDPNPEANLQAVNFTSALQGQIQVDYRVNYDRQTNAPHNPFSLTSTSLTVDCPVGTPCTMNAEGAANYTPVSVQPFGNTATVLYSRVNIPRKRVMCNSSTGSCNGSLLLFYEFYADQNADQNPATRALITGLLPDSIRQRSLDSSNWYRNYYHNAPADGQVNPATVVASPSLLAGASNYTNGTQTINYTYSGARGYPYKGTVTATAPAAVEPWLIYDPYVPAETRVKGQIEFYGPGSWTSGATGQKANTGTKQKTNRRIRW